MRSFFSLLPEGVATLSVESKSEVLRHLAENFARVFNLDAQDVFDRLDEREKLGSTGFGRGIAIPHARVPGINRPVAVLFRLDEPVDFAAADAMPVNLVFGLLSPENAGVGHLHALAAISRLVKDEGIHEALLEAPDAEALYALLTNATDQDAA